MDDDEMLFRFVARCVALLAVSTNRNPNSQSTTTDLMERSAELEEFILEVVPVTKPDRRGTMSR